LNRKKTHAYDIGNPGHGLGQAKKCGRVTIVNGIPAPSPLFITGFSNGNTDDGINLHRFVFNYV
jgi:hypothetical protein